MWQHDWPRRADIGFVEGCKSGDAEESEADRDLVLEDLEQAHDAGTAGRREAIDIEPADRDCIGTQDHRLDNIGAAADAAVDDDARLPADRLNDLRQDIDRPQPVIELAAAMVRHIDAIDPELDGAHGVLDGGDAPQDQRNGEFRLNALDIAPVEPCLMDAGVARDDLAAGPAALVALGKIALAKAVAVGVDGHAGGVVAGVDRAAEVIVDSIGVAQHIELEDLQAVVRRLGQSNQISSDLKSTAIPTAWAPHEGCWGRLPRNLLDLWSSPKRLLACADGLGHRLSHLIYGTSQGRCRYGVSAQVTGEAFNEKPVIAFNKNFSIGSGIRCRRCCGCTRPG